MLSKRVAILSPTGNLGPYLLSALEREGFIVTAIVRESSRGLIPSHLTVIRVGDDYPEDQMIAVFRGHDAVVLCLANAALDKANSLADACVKAKVPKLVASFYGGNVQDRSQDFFPVNAAQWENLLYLKYLEERNRDWSWTGIAGGIFTDVAVELDLFGVDPDKCTATYIGDGSHIFTTTTRSRMALSTARALQYPELTSNTFVYVSSFNVNICDLVACYAMAIGTQFVLLPSPDEAQLQREAKQKLEAGDMSAMSSLARLASMGDHENYFEDVLDFDIVEEDLEDVIRGALGNRAVKDT